MKKFNFTLALALLIVTAACNNNKCVKECGCACAKQETAADSTGDSTKTVALKSDSAMNKAARFYAGISSEGVNMNATDAKAWNTYSQNMTYLVQHARKTLNLVDSIMKTDMADLRKSTDYMFYPFAGADFMYPITMFPDADTYFMFGLEKPGSALGAINPTYSKYESYRKALTYYFQASYFITKNMATELDNSDVDGTVPLISMMMAINDCEIQSVKNVEFNDSGAIVAAQKQSDMAEIKFFKKGSQHLQTLYFYSGNAADGHLDAKLEKYINTTMKQHKVTSYLKAASYLLHYSQFSKIRNLVLDVSQAVIQDDSGIAIKYLNGWDFTLYGTYKTPLAVFGMQVYQPDLMAMYQKGNVHKLPFRIGYNQPSNWLCARKK